MAKLLRGLRPGYPLTRPPIDGEPCGSILRNFEVEKGTLSFFELVTPDIATRLAFSFAKSRVNIDSFDYCVVDSDELAPLQIHFEKTPGNTGIESADAVHHDAVGLTVGRTAALATYCFEKKSTTRVKSVAIGAMLVSALDEGEIKPENLSEKLMNAVAEFRNSSHYAKYLKSLAAGVGAG